VSFDYGAIEPDNESEPLELPSPEWLKGIEEVHAGFAREFWAEYVEESKHRREYVARAGAAGIRHRTLSLIGAWIFGVIALVVAAYLVDRGHNWPGALIGISYSVSTAVSIFAARAEDARDDD